MKTWSPLTEGRFDVARLREPGAWVCAVCRGSWDFKRYCEHCNRTGLYHGPALVDCDLLGCLLTPTEIAAVFGTLAVTPQVRWLVPTREPRAMREWFEWAMQQPEGRAASLCALAFGETVGDFELAQAAPSWPLPNVTIALRVTTQADLDAGIADLLDCPAARRAVLVDGARARISLVDCCGVGFDALYGVNNQTRHVDAVYHRNCAPDVVADLREQCEAAGVPCEAVP